MKEESSFSRYDLFLALILCYFLPFLGMSIYGAFFPREVADWKIFALGCLLTAFGSLVIFWRSSIFEKKLKLQYSFCADDLERLPKIQSQIDPIEFNLLQHSQKEAQEAEVRLLSEIEGLTEEIQKLKFSKKIIEEETENLQSELELIRRNSRQQLEHQQNYIRELQEAIAEQKALNEKKQQQMVLLDTKVSDLTSELKTLLKFAEDSSQSSFENDFRVLPLLEVSQVKNEPVREKPLYIGESKNYFDNPVKNIDEATFQLKKCLDIAQKIKGSQRFGSQIYSFLDSPADNFSLDLRRLCDRLRGESQNIILLYFPKADHLLFASPPVRTFTGWSPEKFSQSFFEIILDDNEWKRGVNMLSMQSEAHIKVQFKTKSGTFLSVEGILGMIPTGIFRNHIIAILF